MNRFYAGRQYGHRHLSGLGDANCDAGMPYDVNGSPCPGILPDAFVQGGDPSSLLNVLSTSPGPSAALAPMPMPLPLAPQPIVGPASGYMLPSNMMAVTFGDGTKGFLDPGDGTYYDSQGNDVTGYVANFGGAKVTGTASAASIQTAEGITPASSSVAAAAIKAAGAALAPGPAPRVTVPTAAVVPASVTSFLSSTTGGLPNIMLLGVGLIAMMAFAGGGSGRRR